MVSINVITDPPSAEVTFNGEIKGISPITIEVELPKTLDDFRDECIGKCGKVKGYMYLPVCEWDVLRGWLESSFVGDHWWELTNDERWCIAYKTTSTSSIEEIMELYNLPCYDATVEPGAYSIGAIQIKEGMSSIDWLFFTADEPEILPGESDTMPAGSIVTIYDSEGAVVAEIDLSYLLFQVFRDECLSEGLVICGWPKLEEWLVSNTVGKIWWDLTFDERYSIADMTTRNWSYPVVMGEGGIQATRAGQENCGGGDGDWQPIDCNGHAMIRCIKWGECIPTADECYAKIDRYSDAEVCYCAGGTYHLPTWTVAVVGGEYGHAVAAIQIGADTNEPSSYYFSQTEEHDIKIGDPQLDVHRLHEVWIILDPVKIGITHCEHNIADMLSGDRVEWHFIDGTRT